MTTWLAIALTVALIGIGSNAPPSNGDSPGDVREAISQFAFDGPPSALPTHAQQDMPLALVAAGRPAPSCSSPAIAGLCRSLFGAGRAMALLWSPATISWWGVGHLPATILARSNGQGPGGSGPPRGRPPWAGEPPTTTTTTTTAPTTTSTAPATTTTTTTPTTTATTAAPTTVTTAPSTTTATTAAPTTAATNPTTTRPPASPPTTTERAAPAVNGPTSTVPSAPTTSADTSTSTTTDEETTTSMPSTTAATTTSTTSTTMPDRTNDQAIAVLDGLPPPPPTPSLPRGRGQPDPSGSLFGVAAASLAALVAYSAALAGRLVGRRRR